MGSSLAKLFNGLSTRKEIGILMVGLDNSGKTTILNKLKLGKFVETEVTVGINVETLEYKDISFTITDIAGQNMRQPYPKFFLHNVGGIIYVVDSNDRDRVFQAKDELHLLLKEDELRDAVLLVLANKQDLPNAMNAGEITDKLGLHSLHPRLWHVQSTCAVSGEGIDEGLEWLESNAGKEA